MVEASWRKMQSLSMAGYQNDHGHPHWFDDTWLFAFNRKAALVAPPEGTQNQIWVKVAEATLALRL